MHRGGQALVQIADSKVGAVFCNHKADTPVIRARKMRISSPNAYFIQNEYDFPVFWRRYRISKGNRVLGVEYQASISSWKLDQRKGIIVFLKKTPNLRLFPFPAFSESLKCQYGAIRNELYGGRQP